MSLRVARLGHRIEAVIHAITRVASKIAMVLLFLMMCLVAADVFGRYLFNHPIGGTIDIIELSLVFVVFLTTADVASRKAHVMVNLVTSRFSKGLQSIMNSAMSLASLVIVALITWQLGVRGWTQILHPTLYTLYLEIPLGPFLLVAAVGSLLLSLVLAVNFCRDLAQALDRKLRR